MGVGIDQARHDDPTFRVADDRALHQLEPVVRFAVAGGDDRAVAGRYPTIDDRPDVASSRTDARMLLFERSECQKTRAAKKKVGLRHSRKRVSMTRSRVKPSSLRASAATCSAASSGIRPISSPRSTLTPAALARDSTSRQTRARDVTVKSRTFIETCARGGSVSMKPCKRLVFRLADVRKANPVGPGSGLRVVEDGDRVTLRHFAAEAMRQGDALVHRHAGEGNERNDVDRTEARMLAFMGPHVDFA